MIRYKAYLETTDRRIPVRAYRGWFHKSIPAALRALERLHQPGRGIVIPEGDDIHCPDWSRAHTIAL